MNFLKRFFSNKYNVLLILLIITHIVILSLFHYLNKNYQTWDSAGHINISFRIANEIKRLVTGEKGVSLVSVLKISNY